MSIQTAYSEYQVHVTFGDEVGPGERPHFALPRFGRLFAAYALAAGAGAVIFLIAASLIAHPAQSYTALSLALGFLGGAISGLIALRSRIGAWNRRAMQRELRLRQ